MDPDEIIKKIEQAYESAIKELELLDKEKRGIIAHYIKELEARKIEEIRGQLRALSSNTVEN
jgi:mRNA-degrading endonuclease RelE of RelBE toxin-antitoxin system